MTYQEALAYLAEATNYERVHDAAAMRDITLGPMRLLCHHLGNPQQQYRSIIVAGTNGKGSVCALLSSVLQQAGIVTGVYTSPHLTDLRERIRVGPVASDDDAADWISQREFAAILQRMQRVVPEVNAAYPHQPLTYFELLTAVAFVYFAQRRVQVAVLEVGLGGRLDATNVAEQTISLISAIGWDHMDVLGQDLAMIAQEKAGIIKAPHVVIRAPQLPHVAEVLDAVARRHRCRVWAVGRDLGVDVIAHRPGELRVRVRGTRGTYEELTTSLVGRHQAEHVAMVVGALEALTDEGVPHQALRQGMQAARWPGRLEVVHEQPTVILDGAHNTSAAQMLKAAVEELWPGRPVHLLIGMSTDKDLDGMAKMLGPMAASVVCTTSRHPRACAAEKLIDVWMAHSRLVMAIPDLADAYTYLVNSVPTDAVVVVTGSLFVVGELRAMVQRIRTQRPQRPATVVEAS